MDKAEAMKAMEIDTNEVVGFIVLSDAGAIYTNQTGGYACHHPQERGFFVPFHSDSFQKDLLRYFFCDGDWNGWCVRGDCDVRAADWMDKFFVQRGIPLRVDRARLGDSEEAWIYCITRALEQTEEFIPLIEMSTPIPAGLPAVFTWENSD